MGGSAAGAPVVLDASSVFAPPLGARGAEVVRARWRTGVIGTADPAEVLAEASDRGTPAESAVRAVAVFDSKVAPPNPTPGRHGPRPESPTEHV